MKFILDIKCNGAAFTAEGNDEGDGVQDTYALAHETARLLREVADKVEGDPRIGWEHPIIDINGAAVGTAKFYPRRK